MCAPLAFSVTSTMALVDSMVNELVQLTLEIQRRGEERRYKISLIQGGGWTSESALIQYIGSFLLWNVQLSCLNPKTFTGWHSHATMANSRLVCIHQTCLYTFVSLCIKLQIKSDSAALRCSNQATNKRQAQRFHVGC